MRWNVRNCHYFGPYKDLMLKKYKQIGLGSIMAQILMNRNCDYNDIKKLMTAPADCLEDPVKIAGCTAAGDAIIDLVSSGIRIWVFADYDVDGLTAGYVMTNYLKAIGANVNVYYPERKEGYGLSVPFLERLKGKFAVITVDNGVTALPAIRYCKAKNIPLVITDHHVPLTDLSDSIVCDPHLDSDGVGHHLCGAAVAWKICQYIDEKLGYNEAWKFTPYVALGTIADVMPMTLENMIITKTGLQLIDQGFAPNIKKYLDILGVKMSTSEDIAWKVAPALNACGRLGNVDLAKRFLYHTGSQSVLLNLISDIDELNRNRKAVSAEAVKVALAQDYGNDACCMFDATDFPTGISGIIAGKLVETFNRPAIVYSRKSNGIWPGSMRSNGFDMLPYLEFEKDKGTIYDYGGHSQACGISLLPDITTFKQSLNGHIRIPLEEFNKKEKVIDVDMEISLSDVNKELYKDIAQIPTDRSLFLKPTFVVKNLKVHEVYHSSNNPDNIRFTLVDNNKELYKLWAWNKDKLYKSLGSPERIDIVGTIGLGFGKDKDNVTFNVEDIKCCS